MVDDKKDLDNDYSALSDALDSGEPAPSLEELLKDHGVDLGTDTDVEAMQDFSLNNMASDESSEPKEPKESEFSLDDFQHDDAFFSDATFEESPFPETPPPVVRSTLMENKKPAEDVDMFESSDFGTSDFDETPGEPLKDDDALFDYDPHTEATFADLGGAEPDMGGDGSGGDGGGTMPPPTNGGSNAKRIAMRLGMLFVLASVIYGGLRLFTGKSTTTVAEGEIAAPPPSVIAHLPELKPGEVAKMPTEVTPTAPAQPEVAMPPAVATAPAPVMPTPMPTPAATVPPMVPPVTAHNLPAGVAPNPAMPQTSMPVVVPIEAVTAGVPSTTPAPGTPVPPATAGAAPAMAPGSLTLGNGDVQQKLNNLELALQSIDQRLAQVGGGAEGAEKMQRLERLANDASAPEMQSVLEEAVKRMKELDRKLERISELQQQVRRLDNDVKVLKEDVVTQTNIVGEQQRLFNDNVQISQLREAGPVKMVVQAAIPGRAWLRSERGELLTVIPGDEVPGYGRVVSIDAASGTVVTSSRAVFREQ